MLYTADFKNDYPIVVCYFTINTMYEQEVRNLKESLNKYKISYKIYGIFSFGTWLHNTGYKAEFMQIMMKKFDVPLIWLDADSIVNRTPILFTDFKKKDVHCCVRIRGDIKTPNLHSAIIYFNNDNKGKQIIEDWVYQCKINMYKVWDQMCLEYVYIKDPKLFELFPRPYAKKSKKSGKRVIAQKQISNISIDTIDKNKDILMYVCSHEKVIEFLHKSLKYDDFNVDNISNIAKVYIEENNLTDLQYNFNPYIFLFSYFEHTKKYISKELYNSNVDINTYIDFNSLYVFYIKNKYKLKLLKNKYDIDHYYACELLHCFLTNNKKF